MEEKTCKQFDVLGMYPYLTLLKEQGVNAKQRRQAVYDNKWFYNFGSPKKSAVNKKELDIYYKDNEKRLKDGDPWAEEEKKWYIKTREYSNLEQKWFASICQMGNEIEDYYRKYENDYENRKKNGERFELYDRCSMMLSVFLTNPEEGFFDKFVSLLSADDTYVTPISLGWSGILPELDILYDRETKDETNQTADFNTNDVDYLYHAFDDDSNIALDK